MRTANERAVEALPRALDGDSAAVRRLVEALMPIVQARVARGLLRRQSRARGRDVRQEVEDIAQEVFVALFEQGARSLRAWRPDGGLSLVNFVGLIAEREVASIMRSGRRSPWSEDPTMADSLDRLGGEHDGPEPEVASRQMLGALLDAMRARLSAKGLQLFRLLFIEERDVHDVGRQMGMSEDALYAWRSRLGRLVRETARDVLGEPGGVSQGKKS